MPVRTPALMEIVGRQLQAESDPGRVRLSGALNELSRHEQYLAVENWQRRYALGSRYGLMFAQLALSLRGRDRDEILYQLLELVADRELGRANHAGPRGDSH